MSDYVKKKIVEKLARFTKSLKPQDISLSFLTGKGQLTNLELDAQFITEVLQLPPWIQVSRVVCDTIRAHVPFTSLRTEPVKFAIGKVSIEVITCTDEGPRKKHTDLLKKIGSNPSKYGFTEKVIDGMRVDIRMIEVQFRDPNFQAKLEMSDIVIQSTTPQWRPDNLQNTRHKNNDEDSVINYKLCSWTSLKVEGWSTASQQATPQSTNSHLRLIAGETQIRIAFKRHIPDSSLMHTRISVHFGDIIWIVTQSQLRAVSRLVQSLMDAAVKTAQRGREGSERSSASSSMESVISAPGDLKLGSGLSSKVKESSSKKDSKSSKKQSKTSKHPSSKERAIQQRIFDYQEGRYTIPHEEVIQNSFHFKCGRIDLQLCDDTEERGGEEEVSESTQGSMLLQLVELIVDVYVDDKAGVGRSHWNKCNDLIKKNERWCRKLIDKAARTQYMDLPSVYPSKLRERSILIRCANFSVHSLRSGLHFGRPDSTLSSLPIITSDKKTFNIPDDIYNPAVQVGVTLYHYPDECGDKFLVPRPNLNIYISPIHLNFHQLSCLWLVEFIHGVFRTVNLELAATVTEEGKAFIEEKKAQSTVSVKQVPGIDTKMKLLFLKVTIPLPDAKDDGRPKALQIETAAIVLKNHPLETLLSNQVFSNALNQVKHGWVFASQESECFPHYYGDLHSLPAKLQKMLNLKMRSKRHESSSSQDGESDRDKMAAPASQEEATLRHELRSTEGWYIHTSCIHIAFAEDYTHEATLNPKSFVDDFPVHVWFFLPPSLTDTMSSSPSTDAPDSAKSCDPTFSFIAHCPEVIRLELERLQLLFIMRLKDSFTIFKDTLMKFLEPPDMGTLSEDDIITTSREGSEDAGTMDGDVLGPSHSHLLHPPTPESDDRSSSRASSSMFKGKDLSTSISGCVIVKSVEASLILPSIVTTSKLSTGTSQRSLSSPPLDVPRPSLPAVVESLLDEQVLQVHSEVSTGSTPSTPSETSNTGFRISSVHTPAPSTLSYSPSLSPSPSQTSQTSLASSSSQLSHSENGGILTQPVLTSSEHLSGSRTSLPVISEHSSSYTSTGSQQGCALIGEKSGRSLSASNLVTSALHHSHQTSGRYAVTVTESPLTGVHTDDDVISEMVTSQLSVSENYQKKSELIETQECDEEDEFVHVETKTEIEKSMMSVSSQHTGESRQTSQSSSEVRISSEKLIEMTSFPGDGQQHHVTNLAESAVVQDEHKPSISDSPVTLSPVEREPGRSPSGTKPSSRRASKASLASRKMKSPSPLSFEPVYNVVIRVDGIFALPTIKPGEIVARVNTNSIQLYEIETSQFPAFRDDFRQRNRNRDEESKVHPPAPLVKARIEIGNQVARFFPPDVEGADSIVIGRASNLDISLLIKNVTVLKDFFDDEFEALNPMPMCIRIENTQMTILEELTHGLDHCKSMKVGVEQVDVKRGRNLLDDADLFVEGPRRRGSEGGDGVDVGGVMNVDDERSPATDDQQQVQLQNNTELLYSFKSFIHVFESHMKQHGSEMDLPQSARMATLLQELRSSLVSPWQPAIPLDNSNHGEAPPPGYTETVPTHGTSHSELIRLRRENEEMKSVQLERDRLQAKLTSVELKLEQQTSDFAMVTDECKRSKEQLVSYKQVMEKQQEHLERLLSENFDLKRMSLHRDDGFT